ncbi:MAG: long-chain-fatty-acid--CoA ligase [Deltaproteobacteria bacterium]|nr:long-chain-fatty-acid--CoA ligase [Deltaproteobacteria bacterium]
MNTTDFLSIANGICPDRLAIVFEGKRWTFAQINDRVDRLANGLDRLGVHPGDRIGILQVNCNEYVESYYASAKLGAIFVPLNFRAKAEELRYMISHAEVKVLFIGSRYWDVLNAILAQLPTLRECISIDGPREGRTDYEDLICSSASNESSREIGDEDITILMYTSGTTGRPKGVPLRHNAFVTYILDNIDPASPEIEERNLLTVPLYHVAGMQAMLAAIYGGRTLVLMRQFEVKEWLETVQHQKATRAMLVPTMLKRVIDHQDLAKYDLSSLKVITYGAAPMPFEVIHKAIHQMPWVRFINAFGQTETASTITTLGPEDHIIEGTEEELERKLKRLTSSIGKPLPDVEVKIVDEEGETLPALEVGEIWTRGSRIMTGYWRDEEKTSQVITSDGWLRTGDMGWMDGEGYIYLAGRADDMIIRGGENISPEEVEDVLCAHPKIEEAAVIGVPDVEWGQEPRAIIVLKKGETATQEEIVEYCRARLAGFKRPRSVVFVDSLPRHPMGKLMRKKLREEYGMP